MILCFFFETKILYFSIFSTDMTFSNSFLVRHSGYNIDICHIGNNHYKVGHTSFQDLDYMVRYLSLYSLLAQTGYFYALEIVSLRYELFYHHITEG